MKFLVAGANGFIGSAVVEALLAHEHSVIAVGRSVTGKTSRPNLQWISQNLQTALTPADWLPLLDGIDGVINCAGILRASSANDFETVHIKAPLALAKACHEKGIKRYIQLSALGEPEQGEFIASKHRFDQQLLELMPSATVLRPSVVTSLRGSYGGSSMLRGLAAFPKVMLLPGKGEQAIQPILLEDLAELMVEAATTESISGVIEIGGPDTVSIKDYLTAVRGWLDIPTRGSINVPMGLINLSCTIGDKLKAGPLNKTIWTMLQQGNVLNDPAAQQQFKAQPRSVTTAFNQQASFVQDRWHAKLFLIQPLIWFLLTVIWFMSAAAGFCAEPEGFAPILSAVGFPQAWHFSLVMLTSVLDLVLGLMILVRYRENLTLWLMLLSTLGYSSLLGVMAPELWLDPLGGLLKNLAIVPLILVYMVMRQVR
ncbi:SDR family oxidoreductase [Neptuniibacter sp. QD72_48]|uniref:SDR family oxidoreductase n=1 Tax=unclassified Neptuniibacter TaxID=2630693 RepID=UPI0039F463E6